MAASAAHKPLSHSPTDGLSSNNNNNTPFAAKALAFVESLFSGAIAGSISKTVIAPADRVKILYQVDPSRGAFSLRNAFATGRTIAETNGFGSLWAGNGATIMRVAPYASITFMSFDHYHNGFRSLFGLEAQNRNDDQRTALVARFCAGSMAGVTSTTITYPLDLMRARFAVHNDPFNPKYPSYYQALVEIRQVEGIRGIYSGLFPTIVGIIPYAGCNFAVFETIKHYLTCAQELDSDRSIPTLQRLVAGGFSGLVSQSLTYPLDIVRRRMQVASCRSLNNSGHNFRTVKAQLGLLGTLRHIHQTEGIKQGLLRGLEMNWIKGPIATAITFTVNDAIKNRIKTYNEYKMCSSGPITIVTSPTGDVGPKAPQPLSPNVVSTSKFVTISPFELGRGYSCSTLLDTTSSLSDSSMANAIVLVNQRLTFIESVISGCIAGVLSKLMTIPIDRLSIMYTVGHLTADEHAHTAKQVIKKMREMLGETRNMWQGSGAMLARVGPYAGITYATFDNATVKSVSRQVTYSAEEGYLSNFVSGTFASSVAVILLYPFNLITCRVRSAAFETGGKNPRLLSYFIAFKNTIRREGFLSLYIGLKPALVSVGPTGGVAFAVYEELKRRSKKERRDTQRKQEVVTDRGPVTGTAAEESSIRIETKTVQSDSTEAHNRGTQTTTVQCEKTSTESIDTNTSTSLSPTPRGTYPSSEVSVAAGEPTIVTLTGVSNSGIKDCVGLAASCPIDKKTLSTILSDNSALYALFPSVNTDTDTVQGPILVQVSGVSDLPFITLLGCGVIAGAVAQVVTYPFNVVCTKEVVEEIIYHGVGATLKNLYSAHGFYDGLYRKLPLGWGLGFTTVGLFFAVNDEIRKLVEVARFEIDRSANPELNATWIGGSD